MQKISELIKHVFSNFGRLLRKKKFWIISFFVLSVTSIFILNTLHESYPDEFDNISGGWLILNGDLIYKSFFTHHGPFPYFLSSFIEIFSGQSFVKFRIVYALLLVIINFSFFALLRLKFKEKIVNYYPLFIVLLGIESTYYWSQMLLADNVAAYAYLFIYVLLLFKVFYHKALTLKDLVFASFVGSIGFYSSLTFTYLYAIFIVAYLYLYIVRNKLSLSRKDILRLGKILFIFFLPHIIFFVYLLITQSLREYLFQNFFFNTKFYIYNYPRPNDSTMINPIRYAIVIANNYFNSIYPLFIRIKDFDLFNPFNVSMVLGNLSMTSYLVLKKHYKFALLSILVLIFSTVRNNPSLSRETDYQSAVYVFISMFNIFFLLPNLYEDINAFKEMGKKVILSFLFILLLIYSAGSIFGFFESFSNRFFAKYMGNAPLIYNRPAIAPIMNTILDDKDTTWVGPFNFEDYFYLKARPASRYHILIPGLAKTSQTRDQLIADLRKANPKAIWFNKHTYILGNSVEKYGKFLTDYLEQNYITVQNYNNGQMQYSSVAPVAIDLDIETSLFLREDFAKEAIDKLVTMGYLRVR